MVILTNNNNYYYYNLLLARFTASVCKQDLIHFALPLSVEKLDAGAAAKYRP